MSSFRNWTMPEIGPGNGAGGGPGDALAPLIHRDDNDPYSRGYTEGVRDGLRDGRREGLRDGAASAEERFGSACDAIEGASRALSDVYAALGHEIEETLTVLSLAVARRIVQREVVADRTVVPDIVRRAVETITSDTPPIVRLNPEDLAALTEAGRRLEVEWVADATIDRGGFVVETPHRVLDGRLDHVLRAFYEKLRDV